MVTKHLVFFQCPSHSPIISLNPLLKLSSINAMWKWGHKESSWNSWFKGNHHQHKTPHEQASIENSSKKGPDVQFPDFGETRANVPPN